MLSSDVNIADSITATQHNNLRKDILTWEVKLSTEKTTASGAISIDARQTFYRIDTEGNAATDDLTTISGGSDGDIIILMPENAARVVTINDGTIKLADNQNFAINTSERSMTLIKNASGDWCELSRIAEVSGGISTDTILLFDSACPAEWARFTALDAKIPRGSSSYGGTGGATTHTHTIATVPAHTHNPGTLAAANCGSHLHSFAVGGNIGLVGLREIASSGHSVDARSTSTCATHTHTITGTTATTGSASPSTATASNWPPFLNMIYCKRD
jgi:hypothetical protein